MSQQLQSALMELSRTLDSGLATKVLADLTPLQKKFPKNPDILHLRGLAYKKLGDLKNAMASMQASLKLAYDQPQVHNNLANIFKNNAQPDLAEKHYRKALDLQAGYVDAWKNLGLFLFEQHRLEEAINALKQALQLRPKNASVLTILADVYKEQEDFVSAEKYYLAAIAINPHALNAIHNLGLLYKLNDRLEDALGCYEKALGLSPENIDINFSYANALYEAGQHQKAEQIYKYSIELKNDFIPAHEWLNEFYWQMGMQDKFCTSYVKSLEKEPANQDLIYSYANIQFVANKPVETKTIIQRFAAQTTDPRIARLKGKMFVAEKKYALAKTCFEQALAYAFTPDSASELIKLNIINGDYDEADRILDLYLSERPYDQLAWALRSLNWRLQGDQRFEWLTSDYAYVKSYILPCPDGYSNLPEFLQELTDVLLNMHTTQKEPLRQTLKLGSQTPGRLLYKRHPVIQLLKTSFSSVVEEYINFLPEDPTHPLLGRKSNKFIFSGSWSVKLNSGGFHVNHVHPEGWLSSSFYVVIPKTIDQDNGQQQGAIKFGESPFQLGDREEIGKIITPQPGMLALFPSYTWHGTIPFDSANGDFRLTAPFDVSPV